MDTQSYHDYLNTPTWRIRRNRALQASTYRCERCGAGRGLQVHHRTYERIGAEWDEDLEVLCESCHRGETIQQMHDQPQSRVYLKLASDVLAEQPYASLADLAADVKDRCAALGIPSNVAAIDKALSVLSASSRLTPPPAQTAAELYARRAESQPISHAEAREFLTRLGFSQLIKTMPMPKGEHPLSIDIYGREPRDDQWVDHDRY